MRQLNEIRKIIDSMESQAKDELLDLLSEAEDKFIEVSKDRDRFEDMVDELQGEELETVNLGLDILNYSFENDNLNITQSFQAWVLGIQAQNNVSNAKNPF